MATNAKALKSKWHYHSGKATELLKQTYEVLKQSNVNEIATRLIEELADRLKTLVDLEPRIVATYKDDDDEVQDFCVEACSLFDDMQSCIAELKRRTAKAEQIKSEAKDLTPPVAASSSASAVLEPPSTPFTPKHRFNLPKLQLPRFNGNALHFLSFRDKFNAAVNDDKSLAPVEKLQYLTAQLSGDAAQLIEGLPLTNASYDQAMELLETRYGKPDVLVSAYLDAIMCLKAPSADASSLRTFYDNLTAYLRGLHSLGEIQSVSSNLLLNIVKQKLPHQVQTQLYRDNNFQSWDITRLMQALLKEINAKACGNIANPALQREYDFEQDTAPATASFVVSTKHRPRQNQKLFQSKRLCVYCKQSHFSANCPVITDPHKRKELLQQTRRCFNCLSQNHAIKSCTSTFTCRNCKGKHHSSICLSSHERSKQATSTNKPATQQEAHVTFTPTANTVLLKTAKATVTNGQTQTTVNILLDEGSQRTFISQTASQRLQIKTASCPTESISISTFGDTTHQSKQYPVANLDLITREGIVTLSAIIVPNIAAPIKNIVPRVQAYHDYLKYLPLASHTADEEVQIDLLIGADFFWSIVKSHVVRGPGPTAVASKLGYLLSGPSNIPAQTIADTTVLTSTCLKVFVDKHQELRDLSTTYWDLETIGITENPKETCFDYATYCNEKLKQNDDGKYTACLPWKTDHEPLPTNFAIAQARTRSMIRRLDKQTIEVYDRIIKEQLQKDFIEQVPNDNATEGHYIPHHYVNKDSPTTPIRIVYDCSCSTRNSPSLNDCLEQGTSLVNDLVPILIRFRTHRIAFTSDIEKAFLNIRLHESDRSFTKFFWLSDATNPESEFHTFRFKSVLFGATSSPFMLNAVVRKHLDNHPSDVTDNLRQNIYVDNLLTGVSPTHASQDYTQKAVDYYNEATSLMRQAGFNLRSWATNSTILRTLINTDQCSDSARTVNALGLRWDTDADQITFPTLTTTDHFAESITKRGILKFTAALFDPMGLLSPVHVKAKILIQKLWLDQCDWDQPVSPAICNQWSSIYQDLCSVRSTLIKRLFFDVVDNDPIQLHVFCDASASAYGAAAYIKYKHHTSLVMSRTRVKPLKEISLPRLELMATLLGARLAKYVTAALQSSPFQISELVLWTDSQITLHWITCEKKLPVFVSNRVREIRNVTFNSHRYCPSAENPADLLTRGISTAQLQTSTLWWHGPYWLAQSGKQRHFPDSTFVFPCIANCEISEQAPQCQTLLTASLETPTSLDTDIPALHHVIDTKRFSTLDKLFRVTAYVCRFIHTLRNPSTESAELLTAAEIIAAEQLWIRSLQRHYYSKEIQGQKTCLVRQLRLIIDKNGILRAKHRIENASLQYSAKFPILLPPNDHFTSLLIKKAHSSLMHSGTLSTMTHIRNTYWIPKLRQRVKSLLRQCVLCRKITGRPYAVPTHAPLPACRIRESLPFAITGVDFTGVLHYKNDSSALNKCYVCLFTCAVTRAVHLEIVVDLTTDAFLRAFKRFTCRRSLPSHIISDNATTFTSAAETIDSILQNQAVQKYLSDRRVKWTFITKQAPWFGGFFERLIGMTKTVLRKVLGRNTATLDELQTYVTEAECVINDRPLTYVSSDADEPVPLTPAHLLHGRTLTPLPDFELQDEDLEDQSYAPTPESSRQRLERLQIITKSFWTRWRNEYLPLLRERHEQEKLRGTTTENKVKVGDVVLIQVDNAKRVRWPLAKIVEVHSSQDGLIRSATLKTRYGITNRPIAKLYPLELSTPPTENRTPSTSVESNSVDRSLKRSVRDAATRAMTKIYQQIYEEDAIN